MSEEQPTPEEIRASIVPDSTQLNAEDCTAGPITVTIERVTQGPSPKQPVNVHLVGYDRVFRPCKTSRRVMIAVWETDDAAKWIGNRITLYTDPDVMYGGVKVGGLRISHASGITVPKTLILAYSRTKRQEITIQPLKTAPGVQKPHAAPPVISPEEQAYIDGATLSIASAESLEVLAEIGDVLKEASKAAQAALRGAYRARKAELEAAKKE